MSETPSLSIIGAVATVCLNRPATHNALEPEDLSTLHAQFTELAANKDVRVVVLTGAGKSFCSGASLGDVAKIGSGEASDMPISAVSAAIENLPQLSICALNGSVYGGGVELAMACDFRLGIRGMRSFVPPARFGIHYPASGIRLIATRLGLQVAKRLLLAAETLDGPALEHIGFCDWWAEDAADFEAQLHLRAGEMAGFAPMAVSGMKKALNDLAASRFDEAAVEAFANLCWASDDFKEGLAAKAEGRAPNFTGK